MKKAILLFISVTLLIIYLPHSMLVSGKENNLQQNGTYESNEEVLKNLTIIERNESFIEYEYYEDGNKYTVEETIYTESDSVTTINSLTFINKDNKKQLIEVLDHIIDYKNETVYYDYSSFNNNENGVFSIDSVMIDKTNDSSLDIIPFSPPSQGDPGGGGNTWKFHQTHYGSNEFVRWTIGLATSILGAIIVFYLPISSNLISTIGTTILDSIAVTIVSRQIPQFWYRTSSYRMETTRGSLITTRSDTWFYLDSGRRALIPGTSYPVREYYYW